VKNGCHPARSEKYTCLLVAVPPLLFVYLQDALCLVLHVMDKFSRKKKVTCRLEMMMSGITEALPSDISCVLSQCAGILFIVSSA
jgi:hypothetical protein